jgi:hypothetical protein
LDWVHADTTSELIERGLRAWAAGDLDALEWFWVRL